MSLSLSSAISVVSSEYLRLLIFIYWKKKESEVIVRCYLHWFKCQVPHCKVSASSGHRNLSVLTLKSYLLSVRVTLAFQPVFAQANLHISNNTKSVKNNKFWWNSHRIGALHYREQNPRLLWLDGLVPTAGSHCSLFSTLKSWGSSQRFGFHLTLTMQSSNSSPDSFLGERKLSYLQGNQWNNAGIHLETSPVRNVCVREEVACTNGNGSTFVIL